MECIKINITDLPEIYPEWFQSNVVWLISIFLPLTLQMFYNIVHLFPLHQKASEEEDKDGQFQSTECYGWRR